MDPQVPQPIPQPQTPVPPTITPTPTNSAPKKLIIVGVLLVLLLTLGGVYTYLAATRSIKQHQTNALPSLTPTPSPTPLSSNPTPTSTISAAPTVTTPLWIQYKDKEFNYGISYPNSWIFKRTYGSDIPKQAPTDILSGIEITQTLYESGQPMQEATIVVNVLDRHALADTQDWIDQYDLNYPKNATKENVLFNQLPAIKYSNFTQSNHPTEYIYFLSGQYAYRIEYWESAGISQTTRTIVNSFTP